MPHFKHTVQEQDEHGAWITCMKGDEPPAWMLEKVRAGNTGIIVEGTKSETAKQKRAREKAEAKVASQSSSNDPFGLAHLTMAQLEELAVEKNLDPDTFSTRTELEYFIHSSTAGAGTPADNSADPGGAKTGADKTIGVDHIEA